MVAIPFCGQAYMERLQNANAQRCVNLYPVRSPSATDPNRIVLYPGPGYNFFQDTTALGIVGTGAIRGFLEINDVLYLISGNQFLRATYSGSAYSFAKVGSIGTYTGRCSLSCNTVEIAISDGSAGYVHNLTTGTFTATSGGSFPSSGGVTNFTYQDVDQSREAKLSGLQYQVVAVQVGQQVDLLGVRCKLNLLAGLIDDPVEVRQPPSPVSEVVNDRLHCSKIQQFSPIACVSP